MSLTHGAGGANELTQVSRFTGFDSNCIMLTRALYSIPFFRRDHPFPSKCMMDNHRMTTHKPTECNQNDSAAI